MSFEGIIKKDDHYTEAYVKWLEKEVERLSQVCRAYSKSIDMYSKQLNRQTRFDNDFLPWEDEGRD